MSDIDIALGELFQATHTSRARALMGAIPLAMVVIDKAGLIQAFSKSAETMFGHAEADVLGQNVSMLMGSAHRTRHDGYLERYLETGERRIIGSPRVENAMRRDGSTFPIELSIAEVDFEGDICFVGFIRALGEAETSRREMRSMLAELAQSSRISAMGALATAIAHELNQPLTTIANYAEGLRTLLSGRDDMPDRDEFLAILENCSKQAVRAGQLLHRLREFVKGGEPRREPVDVALIVDEAVSLALINGFKRAVHINTDLPDDLPRLHVDPLQAQQVLFNLIRNAFEAMDAEHGEHHLLRISARPAQDGFVAIAVEDNGPGIEPEMFDSVFDSFVTTKQEGMGVGLMICRQIVSAYGGKIWADGSADLGGAAFHLTLPIVGHPTGEEA